MAQELELLSCDKEVASCCYGIRLLQMQGKAAYNRPRIGLTFP